MRRWVGLGSYKLGGRREGRRWLINSISYNSMEITRKIIPIKCKQIYSCNASKYTATWFDRCSPESPHGGFPAIPAIFESEYGKKIPVACFQATDTCR